MLKENEQVPDIEKLGHDEFDLDIEEQTFLQEAGEAEVQRVHTKLLEQPETMSYNLLLNHESNGSIILPWLELYSSPYDLRPPILPTKYGFILKLVLK